MVLNQEGGGWSGEYAAGIHRIAAAGREQFEMNSDSLLMPGKK